MTSPQNILAVASLFLMAVLSSGCGSDSGTTGPGPGPASPPNPPKATTTTDVAPVEPAGSSYRLVRLIIPAESPHRQNSEIDNRRLHIVIHEDGKKIGESSRVNGWEADFPNERANHWTLYDERSYTVHVYYGRSWVGRLARDVLIFSVSGLTVEDFDSAIVERGGEYVGEDRLGKVIFEPLP